MRHARVLAQLLLGAPLAAQEIDRAVLDKVKAAAAFVVVEARGTGSGFLFLKRGTTGYLITCEHVVRGSETVKIVFNSGAPGERSVDGRVIAADPERDLACVVLKAVKDLPAPLELGKETSVAETQAVYAAGFPFGQMLSAGGRNPEISISKGSVASIRRNEDKQVVAVQLSGDINPGNSGGAVIDAKGRVIGVARAKITGTSTAFCVPPEEIQAFLKGRVKSSTFRRVAGTATAVRLEAALGLVDPLATLRGVGVAWCPEKTPGLALEPGKDGWGRLHTGMKTQALKVDEDEATGLLELTRTAGDPPSLGFLVQVYFTTADGKTHWTEPTRVSVDFSDTSAPAAAPVSRSDPKEVAPPPPPAKGSSIPIADEIQVAASLSLRSVIQDLVLSPDGSSLYALDLSDGRLLRLKPETLEIQAQGEVIENAVAMALSPDGRTIYVASRDPNPQKPSGSIQTVPASTLKPTGTFQVPFGFHRIAAASNGLIAATGVGQWGGFAVVDASKRTLLGTTPMIYGGASLRLHPDQTRVYTGDFGLSPADFHCVLLRKNAQNQYDTYDSPYHGEHPLGGNFEITPDGRYLIGCGGSVLRLGKTREADLRHAAKIDAGVSVGVSKGSNTFVVATAEGFLKVYDLSTFELQKSIKVGVLCTRVVLDGPRGRLHAAISPAAADSARFMHFDAGSRAGDLASFSLTGK